MKFYEYEHSKISEYSYGYKSFNCDDLQQDLTYSITPDGVYNVNDKQFQKDNFYEQNDIPNYLFFKPFFYFFDKKWHLFKNKCNQKFEFISKNIIKKKEKKKKGYGLELNFSVNIEKNSFKYNNFEIQVENVNKDEFLKSLDSFRMHTNYYFTVDTINNIISNCSVCDGYLIKKDSFLLTGTIVFNFDIKAKEKISINFNKNSKKGIKKNNYVIKIPNYFSTEEYDCDKKYCVGNTIFYKGDIYKCKKNCQNVFPFQNNHFWTLVENFKGSFFNSIDGKKSLNLLKEQLCILVEQKISDEVILTLAHNDNTPVLNDFFEFSGKKYRIIEIFKKNSEGVIYLIVKGIEILNFNNINFDEITKGFDKEYGEVIDIMNLNKVDNTFLEVFFLDRLIVNQEKKLELILE